MNLRKIYNKEENQHTLRKKVLKNNMLIIKSTVNNIENEKDVKELIVAIFNKEINYLPINEEDTVKINIFIGYKDDSQPSSKYIINFKSNANISSNTFRSALEKATYPNKDEVLSYITLSIGKVPCKKTFLKNNFRILKKLGGQYAK